MITWQRLLSRHAQRVFSSLAEPLQLGQVDSHGKICTQTSMFAKDSINVSGAAEDFVTKPLGHRLESVPLVNPARLKAGELLTSSVLLNSMPRLGVRVWGNIEGFHPEESTRAFSITRDKDGKFDFKPLTDGI